MSDRADHTAPAGDAATDGTSGLIDVGAVDVGAVDLGAVGVGVVGARSMVARLAVLPAIDSSPTTRLVAAASLGGPVPDPWTAASVPDYRAVIDHPDVAAVYVPLSNGMHEEWVIEACRAGKHVLCEKPLAPTSAAARRMQHAADTAGVLLAEAWMTPFDHRWAEALRLAESGRIGTITSVRSTFTFTIGPDGADNYRWDVDQGGGALLDVGIYCLGPAVRLFGPSPSTIEATSTTSRSGVDASTTATLTWQNGATATIDCSFVGDECQRLELVGTDGTIVLDGDAHTGGPRARDITVTSHDGGTATDTHAGRTETIRVDAGDPYLGMVEHFAAAVDGTARWERSIDDSIAMLELITRVASAATPRGDDQS